jgi:hypothetical protein
MEDDPAPPALRHDVNFESRPDGYEIWFSDRIAEDHPSLVDQFAEWLEDDIASMNLGQIDHRAVLADGVLSEQVKVDIVAWWVERVEDLDQG